MHVRTWIEFFTRLVALIWIPLGFVYIYVPFSPNRHFCHKNFSCLQKIGDYIQSSHVDFATNRDSIISEYFHS